MNIRGIVTAKSITLGDYVLKLEPAEGGIQLSIIRGNEIQSELLPAGTSPSVDIEEAEGGYNIRIVDVNGEKVHFLAYSALPEDGETGQVLTKTEDGTQWADAPSGLPEGGAPYQQLVTDGDGVAVWEDRTHYSNSYNQRMVTGVAKDTYIFNNVGSDNLVAYVISVKGGTPESLVSNAECVEGDTLEVVIDGVSYFATVKTDRSVQNVTYPLYAGNASLGTLTSGQPGENTGELFYINDSQAGLFVDTSFGAGNHTVAIYKTSVKKEIKTLSEIYLPTTVPVIQSATVGQTVVVKAVDDTGKPTEWEAVDSYLNLTINPAPTVETAYRAYQAFKSGAIVTHMGNVVTRVVYNDYTADGEDLIEFYINANNREFMYAYDSSGNLTGEYVSPYLSVGADAEDITSETSSRGTSLIHLPGEGEYMNCLQMVNANGLIIGAYGSNKQFRITVDDSGTLTATEVTE